VKPEEVIKARLIDSYVCRPIKALQGALLFEAGTAQSVLKMNILPALDFVIEDEFEKLRQVELFLAGVGEVRMPGGKLVRMATPESISSGTSSAPALVKASGLTTTFSTNWSARLRNGSLLQVARLRTK
jgi:hypothetical protein